MAQAMSEMNYDLVTFLRNDFAMLERGTAAPKARQAPKWFDLSGQRSGPELLHPFDPSKTAYPPEASGLPFFSKGVGGVSVGAMALSPSWSRGIKDHEKKAKALSKEIARLLPDKHFKILLCPLGEEESDRLAKEIEDVDLILNAGRKTSQRISWTVGGTVVVNFDYQVQRLVVIEVSKLANRAKGNGRPKWDVRVRLDPIKPELPEAPAVSSLLQPHLKALQKKGKQQVTIEYWTMGFCPYCKEVGPDLEQIASDLKDRVHLEPHFLVSRKAGGGLQALHGDVELQENRIQALIYKYYPEKYWDWVRWRMKDGNEDAAWEKGAAKLGLLKARIKGALQAGEGDELLERDFRLSLRRRVRGTPTLVLANKLYEGPIERLKVLRVLCGLLDQPKPAVCEKVPKCFMDAHCKKRGYIGRCLEKGTPKARCDFSRKALELNVIVLVEPDSLFSNHEKILQILVDYLPGLRWTFVDPFGKQGLELTKRFKLERFPAYLIDRDAEAEADFESRLSRLVRVENGKLVLRSGMTGAHRIRQRQRIRGRVDLFVARHSKYGQQAVEAALEVVENGSVVPDLRIHDALFWRETVQEDGSVKRELASQGGLAEIEEAARGLAVRRMAPEKFRRYLKAQGRGQRRGSSYWDRALVETGIEVAAVRNLSEKPAAEILKEMQATADLLKALEAGGKVILLGENCELIPVQSRRELAYYLEMIGKRKINLKPHASTPKPAVLPRTK